MTAIEELKRDGKCCFTHLIARQDGNDHIFAILDCQWCEGKSWCRKLTAAYEKELNTRQGVQKILDRVG